MSKEQGDKRIWGQVIVSSAQQQDKGNGHKLDPRRFPLNRNFFPLWVLKHRTRLSKGIAKSLSPERFQTYMDVAILCNLL